MWSAIELWRVRRLVMDEFALHKGTPLCHRDHGCQRTRVLWVGHSNQPGHYPSRFFRSSSAGGASSEAVAMDAEHGVRPGGETTLPAGGGWSTTYSRVVARYGREVVDRVRVEQAECTEKR